MVDKVKPLKMEHSSSGGTEDDTFPTETDPSEDYLACKGISFENTEDQIIDIDSSSNEMRFEDQENGSHLMSEFLQSKVSITNQYQLIGTMNYDQYLYSMTDQIGGLFPSARRSGDISNGYRYANCAPLLCPIDGSVVRASFAIQGAAVSGATRDSLISVNFELWNVGMTSEGNKIDDISINIPYPTYNVGQWWNSSVDTNFTGSVDLNINVSENQLLALKFKPDSGTDVAQSVDNVTVVLRILET